MVKKISDNDKNILGLIFCNNLNKLTTVQKIIKQTNIDKKHLLEKLENLKGKKYIIQKNNSYFITKKGRLQISVVLTGGVYDIIHPGHIYTLKKSKKMGDVLIVSIATDKRVKKIKNKKPLNNEKKRASLVSAIRYVDHALVGSKKNIFDIVKKIKPDIITIGYDQKHNMIGLKKLAMENKMKIRVVKLDSPIPKVKSSLIINRNIQKETEII
ncbi:MAG: cytidyltransferase [Thaumarchaeota archaeon]|nr:cytidyltransferase [Nitrososphaerota archaeon]